MKFTVFTPCYNVEDTIHRVFESMNSQTNRNFEWIIINDGSTDNSSKKIRTLLNKYESLSKQTIFIEQQNQGKHRSWNKAVKMAKGELFVPADGDDSFLPETLDFFEKKWAECGNDHLSGINVCCMSTETSEIIGTPYPSDGLISNNIELQYRYNIKGEHWGCIRTDLLKRLLFPNVEGHYYPENYLWYTLAKDYNVVCFNKPLRYYYFEPNSISNSKNKDIIKVRNQKSYLSWVITHCGKIIFSYSKRGLLVLIRASLRISVYYYILSIKNSFNNKSI